MGGAPSVGRWLTRSSAPVATARRCQLATYQPKPLEEAHMVEKKRPNAVLKLIADALKRKAESNRRKTRKPRRPWGLPPNGGR
jgi:hypothetical protein